MTHAERADFDAEPSRVRDARIKEGQAMSKGTPVVLLKGLLVTMLRDPDSAYDKVISHMMKLLAQSKDATI